MRCVLVDSETAREEGVEGVEGVGAIKTIGAMGTSAGTSAGLDFLVGVVNTLSDGGHQLRAILPEIFP
jgi:hypothetical protein